MNGWWVRHVYHEGTLIKIKFYIQYFLIKHLLFTYLVICGALIAKKISVRMVTLIGALIFLGFAVASLFIDPYEENHLVPDVEVKYKHNTIDF